MHAGDGVRVSSLSQRVLVVGALFQEHTEVVDGCAGFAGRDECHAATVEDVGIGGAVANGNICIGDD